MATKKDVAQKRNINVKKQEKEKQQNNKEKNINKKSRKTKATKFIVPFSAGLIVVLVFLFALIITFISIKYINLEKKERLNVGIVITTNDKPDYFTGMYLLMGQNKPRYNFTILGKIEEAEKSYIENKLDVYIYNDNLDVIMNTKNNLVEENLKLIFRASDLFIEDNFKLTEEQFKKLEYSTITTRKHIDFNGEEDLKNNIINISKIKTIEKINTFVFVIIPVFLLIFIIRNVYENILIKKETKKEVKKITKKENKEKIKVNKKEDKKVKNKKEAEKLEIKKDKDNKKKKEKEDKDKKKVSKETKKDKTIKDTKKKEIDKNIENKENKNKKEKTTKKSNTVENKK